MFPAGVPVHMLADKPTPRIASDDFTQSEQVQESDAHAAEGDLTSEASEIRQQAQQARSPEAASNLLDA